ncbi:hypothetical protein Tco_1518583, partial [Tanacetum coccineum]
DGESIESYYLRFYKMMNEMVRNKLEVATMQGNVQFLQQLQLEWSRSVDDMDEEPDEQELEAHYMYMAKIQEVPTAESRPTFDVEPLEKVQFDDDYNVFTNEIQHSEQPESINDTYVVEKVDSSAIPDSSDMCDNDGKDDQNAKEYEDECVVLANLIANLKLDIDENKTIQKQ